MLSRTAAHLFWMSRHLERAENTARLLDVLQTMATMPHPNEAARLAELRLPLIATGSVNAFFERYDALSAVNLVHFFALDEAHPASIRSSLLAARQNAHSERGRITTEMWEAVNTTWLEMARYRPEDLAASVMQFCEWVKDRSHVFRGATHGTLVRDEAYAFLRLGTFIERADNTLRLLDTRTREITAAGPSAAERVVDSGQAGRTYFAWNALLQALSAVESYAVLYRQNADPRLILEMLLINPRVPRSLAACVGEIHVQLDSIESPTGRKAQRVAAEIAAHLRYTTIDDIESEGAHRWLQSAIERTAHLATTIQQSFMEVI